jgi:Protein of unknown function (DUF3631)
MPMTDDRVERGKVVAQQWATTAHARMLDDIRAMLVKYVAFPNEHSAVACTLWVAHTWVVTAFFTTPRLIVISAEPGSGKTRLLELLALLCHHAKVMLNTSPAALYRRISASEHPPTVLADEIDAVFGRNPSPGSEDLRALYNSGYRKGATVDRCEGDGAKMKVTEFKVFAPVGMAGIGAPPRTITTRGITIPMRKRAPGETVAPFRERDSLVEANPIVEKLKAWAAASYDAISNARPTIPGGVVDRPAEVWEPLLAVAESAGGDWPKRARAACRHFVLSVVDDNASLGVRLLAAIHDLYNPDGQAPMTEMHSADIVNELTRELDSPWRDLWGKQLDQRRLAAELRKYDLRPKQIRIDGKVAKGYLTGPHHAPDGNSMGLADAWQRYLPPDSRNNRNDRNTAAQDPQEPVTDNPPVTDASVTGSSTVTESDPPTSTVTDVSDVTAISTPTPATMPRHLESVPQPKRQRQRTRGKFRAPTGPDRCDVCGWHTPTQGHDFGCSANRQQETTA